MQDIEQWKSVEGDIVSCIILINDVYSDSTGRKSKEIMKQKIKKISTQTFYGDVRADQKHFFIWPNVYRMTLNH